MFKQKRSRRVFPVIFSIVILCSLLIGCQAWFASFNPNDDQAALGTKTELFINSVDDLKDSLQQIQSIYEAKFPIKLIFNFGTSSSLQQPVDQAQSVDIMISDHPQQVNLLAQKGLIVPNSRMNLVGNQLVLITSPNYPKLQTIQQLNSPEIKSIALGNPQNVSSGKFTTEALKSLKLWSANQKKLIFFEETQQVLKAVESRKAEVGFVYLSDAKTSPQVRIVETIPEKFHSPILYPFAIFKKSKHLVAAEQFRKFLLTQPVRTIFEERGFTFYPSYPQGSDQPSTTH